MRPVAYIGAIAAAIAIGIAGSFGNGAAASLQPSSGAFGSQDIASGPTAPQTFTLRNTGTATLTYVASITGANAADFAVVNPCGSALGAGSSCPLTVTFDPSAASSETASLSITDNAPGSPHTASLSGTGTSSGGGGGGSVTKTVANLWVDPTGGTCTRQSSPGAWVDAQGCTSMQAALTAASAGDTVVVKCGTSYGTQSITTGQKASAVTFYAETYYQAVTAKDAYNNGTTCATVAALDITSVDHLHVFGLQATNASTFSTTSVSNELEIEDNTVTAFTDVVIDGWHGHQMQVEAPGTTVRYSVFGNTNFCSSYPATASQADFDATRFWAWPNFSGNAPNNDSLIYSVVHDWVGPPDGQCGRGDGHNDNFQSPGGNNMVISNDLFWDGPTSNMQIGDFTGGLIGTLTIENNYLGDTSCCNNLSIGQGHCAGIVERNNVVVLTDNSGIPDNNNGCTGTMTQNNNIYVGNVNNCVGTGGTFSGDHNIFQPVGGATCGTNSKRCTPSWVSGPPPSVNTSGAGTIWTPELNPGDTCARDYSNASFPATDMFNTARPIGVTSDAGPVEGG